MSDLTEKDAQLGERMAGLLYDAFRSMGVSMASTDAMEKLRTIGENMAAVINSAAERKSIQVAEKLQTAVVDAFSKIEDRLNKTLEESAELKRRLDDQAKED